MQTGGATAWWFLDLGDGMLALEPCHQIKERFGRMHADHGRPASMAVFIGRIESDLHCRVIAYFTPACEPLAITLGAVPCIRPNRTGLELLAGDPACWSAIFGRS